MKKPLASLALAALFSAASLTALAAQPQAGASNEPLHNTGNPSTQANPSSATDGGNGGASIPDPQRTPQGTSKQSHDTHGTQTGSGAVGGKSQPKGETKQQ